MASLPGLQWGLSVDAFEVKRGVNLYISRLARIHAEAVGFGWDESIIRNLLPLHSCIQRLFIKCLEYARHHAKTLEHSNKKVTNPSPLGFTLLGVEHENTVNKKYKVHCVDGACQGKKKQEESHPVPLLAYPELHHRWEGA